ncbi:DUF4960 domain-containing protein [bacterium]|nr:DUF4960 domain-containing protein [bacterium]
MTRAISFYRNLLFVLFAGAMLPTTATAGTLALIGQVNAFADVESEAHEAYEWAGENLETRYISLNDLAREDDALDGATAIWWHYTADTNLPSQATVPETIRRVREFVEDGGGVLLSGFAAQYVVNLGIENTPPTSIESDFQTSGVWGFQPRVENHPAFRDFEGPIHVLSEGLRVQNNICWWDDPAQFHGRWLADLEWDGGKVAMGEYSVGSGKVIVIGAGAFEWQIDGRENQNRKNLEKLTENTLVYLGAEENSRPDPAELVRHFAERKVRIGLLGAAMRTDMLTAEEGAAYDWAAENAVAEYVPFADLTTHPVSDFDVLWWHEAANIELSEEALEPDTTALLRNYIKDGGGLLLTGFAVQYAVPLGIEDTPPTTVLRDPSRSDGWGFRAWCESHPVFANLPNPFLTVADGTSVDNVLAWWDSPSDFDGIWLADNENTINKVAAGEYRLGRGKVIVVGSGAFDWHTESPNSQRSTLEVFTANLLGYLATPNPRPIDDPSLLAWWRFDRESKDTVLDLASGMVDPIANNYGRPEYRAGAAGDALLLDGFSTWVERDGGCAPMLTDSFTIEAWIAAKVYPPAFAPFINQHNAEAGYTFGVTKFGQWGFRINIGGIWHAIWAPELLPKDEWVHVAATMDSESGLALFLNGEEVERSVVLNAPIHRAEDADLLIGRDNETPFVVDLFPMGVFNGLIDEVKIYDRAMDPAEIAAEFANGNPPAQPDLTVRPDRFEADHLRPQFHVMPASDWTNEPHGLVQMDDGKYHLFYQNNPSGPYWAFIHWGHMASDDLVHWEEYPIALAPQPGMSQEGAWSGDAVNDHGVLSLIYTAVDGSRARIGLARGDEEARHFKPSPDNPIISSRPPGAFMDFRDPYVWKEDATWYCVVGAGVPDVGGTALLYESENLLDWKYLGPLMIGKRAESGFFWEMPVVVDLGEKYFFGVTEMPGRNSYWLGEWKNQKFIPEKTEPTRLEIINHYLSPAVTTDDRGRTIAIGIVPEQRSSEDQLAAGWAHLYGLPRVWSLDERGRLLQQPLDELQQLRGEPTKLRDVPVSSPETDVLDGIGGRALELLLEVDRGNAEQFGLALMRSPGGEEETRLIYDYGAKKFILDRTQSSFQKNVARDVQEGPFALDEGEPLRLHIFIDHSVIEVFAANGRGAFTTRVYPERTDSIEVGAFSTGGTATITKLTAWPMKSIWSAGKQ